MFVVRLRPPLLLQPRPSEVNAAITTLRAGADANDDFCKALFAFPAGEHILSVANACVERHASDVMADSSFDAARKLLEVALHNDRLRVVVDKSQLLRMQKDIPLAGAKLLRSLQTWSSMRAEERIDDIKGLLHAMVSSVVHSAGTLCRDAASILRPEIAKVDNNSNYWLLGGSAKDATSANDVPLVDSTYQLLTHCFDNFYEDSALVAAILDNLTYLQGVCDQVSGVGGASAPGPLQSLVGDAQVSLAKVAETLRVNNAVVDSIEALHRLLTHPEVKYPGCLASYDEWLTAAQGFMREHSTKEARLSAMGATNFFEAARVWFQARKDIQGDIDSVACLASKFCMPVDSFEGVSFVRRWVSEGRLAQAVHDRCWVPVRELCIASVVRDLRVMDFGAIDSSSMQVAANTLAPLIGGDLRPLAAEARKALDFSDPSQKVQFTALHPVRMTKVLIVVLKNTAEVIESDHLQHESSDRVGLSKENCAELLDIYAGMTTAATVAATLNEAMFSDGARLIHFVSKTGAGAPGVSEVEVPPGLAAEPLGMIQSLVVSLRSLRRLVSSEASVALESTKFILKKPVAQCSQWVSCMEVYLRAAQGMYFERVGADIRRKAEELEASIPRWDVVFAGGMDTALAKSRLLDNPKRGAVKPLLRFVGNAFKAITTHSAMWKIDSPMDLALQSFVKSSINTGNAYLVLVAAVSTVLFQRGSPKANKTAEEVLSLAKRAENFVMPQVLQQHLEDMVAGVPTSMQHEPTAKRARASASASSSAKQNSPQAPRPEQPAAELPSKPLKREVPDASTTSAPSAPSAGQTGRGHPMGLLKKAKLELQAASHGASSSKSVASATSPAQKGKAKTNADRVDGAGSAEKRAASKALRVT